MCPHRIGGAVMSAHRTVYGVDLTIVAANSIGIKWVRRHGGPLGGRALGFLERNHSAWDWRPTSLAYIGDGRSSHESDGDRTARVPDALLQGGRERTQVAALEALVMWLHKHEAPVLGHGPHPAVMTREAIRS
jgi:hypothetical protein